MPAWHPRFFFLFLLFFLFSFIIHHDMSCQTSMFKAGGFERDLPSDTDDSEQPEFNIPAPGMLFVSWGSWHEIDASTSSAVRGTDMKDSALSSLACSLVGPYSPERKHPQQLQRDAQPRRDKSIQRCGSNKIWRRPFALHLCSENGANQTERAVHFDLIWKGTAPRALCPKQPRCYGPKGQLGLHAFS